MKKFKTPDDIQIAKQLLSPPGDTIKDTIKMYNLTQTELAERMEVAEETIDDIIKAKTPITQEIATKLERILAIPADFWLKREEDYQIQLHEIQEAEQTKNKHA
ncbi:MAG: HigA family addiction module antitoxin [Bacteroidota bacterium]|nr:HigA family addiction module antitoxin [Bacteroidota bacterium]